MAAFFLAPKPASNVENDDDKDDETKDKDDETKKIINKHKVDDLADLSATYQSGSTSNKLLETSNVTVSLEENTTQKLLEWCSSGESVTGHSIVFSASVEQTIKSYIVPESQLPGFADYTPYDMVEKSQSEKPKEL